MDDGSQWTWLIVILLLFAAVFFAITETAFASVSRVRLKTDANAVSAIAKNIAANSNKITISHVD